MQTRSSPISLQTLHRLADQMSIEGYEKMPKNILYKKLQEHYDLERLLRTESRREKQELLNISKKRSYESEDPATSSNSNNNANSSSSALKKRAKLNKFDPIMFAPILKKNIFRFIRPNGTVVRFNISSLVDYLLASGDFSDPETRIPFSDEDLKEMDNIAKKAGLNKASVLEAKNNVNGYSDSKFRRDALLGLERCAGEVITDILQIVETADPDEAQMQLVMREFPTFLDYYKQIRDADAEYASKCIAHWRLFMEGPPNKPNKDEYGLIYVVCHFLKSCEEGLL
eukprot:gene4195-5966_t